MGDVQISRNFKLSEFIYSDTALELLALLQSSHLMYDQAITYMAKPNLLHLSYKTTGNRMMILERK